MKKEPNNIKDLNPQPLWQRFYEISQIPRESKNEGKIRKHIINYAKKLNLEYKEDKTGNIAVYIPASKTHKNKPIVVLQSHLDMVCEKDKGSKHNFKKDPIQIKIKDDWVMAHQTTLGADNGIGVASMLAMMTEKTPHGPIECLFTIDEETGLTGAFQLEPDLVQGNILLNLDSEEWGVFYIGCAGGADTIATLNKKTIPPNKEFKQMELFITGLTGGHSGVDIHLGRANAIKILARLLKKLEHLDIQIQSISGGSKRNAIARDATSIILIRQDRLKDAQNIIDKFQGELLLEYQTSDNNILLNLMPNQSEITTVLSNEFSKTLINLLLGLPHGLISLCQDIPELVETSSNLAKIETQDTSIKIETSQRSSVESALEYMIKNVVSICDLANAHTETNGGYPGWKPNIGSDIVQKAKHIYKLNFKKSPKIKAIHAGLECGLLGQKFPQLDMLSLGPSITGAHSPAEKVNIKSVELFYNFLLELLKNI